MKLIASKTKTMNLQSTNNASPVAPLTIFKTVLKHSDDLDILGVTFDSKMTFRSVDFRSVSIAASQSLGILRKPWKVYHDRSLVGRCFFVVYPTRYAVVFCSVVLGCRYTP